MSSTLINVGTEPNDGTGDPPRTAALKINANFQAIDLALVATETTAQLDARDTANRARANHTGTQPTSTIANFTSEAAAAAPVQSVAGKTGAVTLAKADVGLGQVDNTSDAYKPISTATQAALSLKLEAGDVAAFETNAQLDSRDTANRARANHTGAQAISTVTGLQTALNAKLEAAAIASFETTTQLNARDTANRARANHTGTQPASSITGLATVATSGAYGDLTGRPTIPAGFTYDQQAEPLGPAAGATWRERSAGGLIIGEWEWSGSTWVGLTRYWDSINALAVISATTGIAADSLMPFHGVFLLERVIFNYGLAAAPDVTNYWQVMMSMVNYAGAAGAAGNPEAATTITLNTVSTGESSQTYNLLVTAGRTRIKATKFSAAPNINRIAMFYQWRAVR